jgi:hypothetical protein
MLKGGPLRHTFHPGSPLKQSAPRKLSHASLDPTRAKWWRPWKADQKNHGDHGVWWVHVIKCSNRWWVPLHYHKNITINSSMYDIYIYIYNIYIYTMYIYIYLYDVRRFTNHHGLSVWYAITFDASCSVHVELAFLNIYFLFPQAIGQTHVLDGIDM